jgi:hypothetical protein
MRRETRRKFQGLFLALSETEISATTVMASSDRILQLRLNWLKYGACFGGVGGSYEQEEGKSKKKKRWRLELLLLVFWDLPPVVSFTACINKDTGFLNHSNIEVSDSSLARVIEHIAEPMLVSVSWNCELAWLLFSEAFLFLSKRILDGTWKGSTSICFTGLTATYYHFYVTFYTK